MAHEMKFPATLRGGKRLREPIAQDNSWLDSFNDLLASYEETGKWPVKGEERHKFFMKIRRAISPKYPENTLKIT